MGTCPVCGNDDDGTVSSCRFCGNELLHGVHDSRPGAIIHRTVNLKHGRPFVDTAIHRLKNELAQASAQNVKVITFIHGYGSSGKGGAIRLECRKVLEDMARSGALRSVISGELFQRRHGAGKALVRRYPPLERECSTAFGNPGVTVVEL